MALHPSWRGTAESRTGSLNLSWGRGDEHEPRIPFHEESPSLAVFRAGIDVRRIGGLIDLPHAALADEGGHVVAPYALESHVVRPETEEVIAAAQVRA